MKFKREIFRRELFEGEKIPFGWGVAYPEWNRHAFILYPTPGESILSWA